MASEELRHGNAEYEVARALMTGEVNAAIRGVLRAVSDAEVLVADSHGNYRNILIGDLDPRASLLRGKPRVLAMVDGVQAGDGVIFIGYHSRAGQRGTLSHTFHDVVRDVRCNGRSMGEGGLNAAVVSARGAMLLMASGDDVFAEEMLSLNAEIRTVIVSQAVSASAAVSVHPSVACELIEQAAVAATEEWAGAHVSVVGAVVVDMDFSFPGQADVAAVPPPVVRSGPTSVRVVAEDMIDAYRWIRTLVMLASQPNG